MAITISNFQDWKKLPVRQALVDFSDGDRIVWEHLKIGSNMTITPINSNNKTDEGAEKTVAYKIESTLIIVENDMLKSDYFNAKYNIDGKTITDAAFLLEGNTDTHSNIGSMTVSFGAYNGNTVLKSGHSVKQQWESSDGQNLEWIINIQSLVSKDIITDVANDLFKTI